MTKRIAIVGAGAKAAAIVARAAVLQYLGVEDVPEILVFEADHIGAAWSGKAGFSSGFLTLCTPGEKDVGFPYNEIERFEGRTEAVAQLLFSRFSWPAYLIAAGRFSEWVDRDRNHPSHGDWAGYLEWVFSQAGQSVIRARVLEASYTSDQWRVSYDSGSGSESTLVDGLVLTGTGRAKVIASAEDIPAGRVFDAETFWAARMRILALADGTIAVAGNGGAAGTIVAWLAERLEERDVSIVSISPMGTLFPRGDGYAERRWFSDPADWRLLSADHRRQLFDRTEAGVISMRNKRLIDSLPSIGFRQGKVVDVKWDEDELLVAIEYDGEPEVPVKADYLINAIGFDSWTLLELIKDPSIDALCAIDSKGRREQAEAEIMPDLSFPTRLGYPPGLHVPGLSGLAHGPGMGNLGCLGLMAQVVLKPYLSK